MQQVQALVRPRYIYAASACPGFDEPSIASAWPGTRHARGAIMAGIDFTSDHHDQVSAWMQAFLSETSLDRDRCACA